MWCEAISVGPQLACVSSAGCITGRPSGEQLRARDGCSTRPSLQHPAHAGFAFRLGRALLTDDHARAAARSSHPLSGGSRRPGEPMTYRACVTCGKPYERTSAHNRWCPDCKPRGRKQDPSTRAQATAEYRRNRKVVLAGDPCCHWCHAPHATTVDHVVPASRGGSNSLDNLVACCQTCNSSRQDNPDWTPPDQPSKVIEMPARPRPKPMVA